IHREIGDKWGIAYVLLNLGLVSHEQGDFGSARTLYEESLAIRREIGDRQGIAYALERVAALCSAQGEGARAAGLWGAAEALREAIGAPMPPNERGRYERQVAEARTASGETKFAAAWHEGRAMTVEQAVEYALGAAN